MKKLLALVLCVVMVLSLAPAAFADGSHQPAPVPADPTDAWPSLYVSNKAISNAKKNIEYLYNGLAADNAVFSGIKAMDSFVVDLAKGLFTDVDDFTFYTKVWDGTKYVDKKFTVSNDTLVKNTKAELRDIIGDSISDYMNDHIASFAEVSTHFENTYGGNSYAVSKVGTTKNAATTVYVGEDGYVYGYDATTKKWSYADDAGLLSIVKQYVDTTMTDAKWATLTPIEKAAYATQTSATNATVWKDDRGTWSTVKDYRYDPIKYANAFSTAMSKALTDQKGAKGLEAYVYGLMQAKVAKEVNDKLDDLYDAIVEWEDGTAILDAYGFADIDWKGDLSLNPYAFINPNNVPKASMDLSDITKPDATSFSWHWDGVEWIAD